MGYCLTPDTKHKVLVLKRVRNEWLFGSRTQNNKLWLKVNNCLAPDIQGGFLGPGGSNEQIIGAVPPSKRPWVGRQAYHGASGVDCNKGLLGCCTGCVSELKGQGTGGLGREILKWLYTTAGGGVWHKALVVGSVSLWRRLLASRP